MILFSSYNSKYLSSTGAVPVDIIPPSSAGKAGDILLAHIVLHDHGNSPVIVKTLPEGWITLHIGGNQDGTKHALYCKVLSDSEPSSYTFTFGSGSAKSIHLCLVESQEGGNLKVDQVQAIDNSGNAASLTSNKDYLYLAFYSAHNTSSLGNPSGLTVGWNTKLGSYVPSAMGFKNFAANTSSATHSASVATKSIAVSIVLDTIPPTTPEKFIKQPSLRIWNLSGEEVELEWSKSTDTYGTTIAYSLDFHDGAEWKNIDDNILINKYTHKVPSIDANIYQYRVRAKGQNSVTSSYRLSDQIKISKSLLMIKDNGKIKTYQNKQWVTIEGAT